MSDVVLDGETLTPAAVAAVARDGATVSVADGALAAVRQSRERIEAVLDGDETVYGVNTGFGELVDERIDASDLTALQHNLVRSHAAGAGDALPREAVRAMLVTRINALAKGHSGVRERVLDHLCALLNEGVTPVVPSRGSLGASGDLAPLAHAALVLLGEGAATVDGDSVAALDGDEASPADADQASAPDADDASSADGERVAGDEALVVAGLEPLELEAKEGLAILNGTQLSVGLAALLVVDAERLVRAADIVGALSTEVALCSTVPSHPAVAAVRPHAGQTDSARTVRLATAGSDVVESHRNCDRVQDPYSFRCLPQVHGAVREAIAHCREAVETELNAATDNPLVFAPDRVDDRASGGDAAAVLSAGNFHGAVLAHRLDYLVGALTDLAAIGERRVDHLCNPNLQEDHLPPFLTDDPGRSSGYMVAQYTAAALLNECRSIGRAATDNTPVSGNQEDHVSMSAQAALNARTVLENARRVVAVELCCGAQAASFLEDDLALGAGTARARNALREIVPRLDEDRPLADEIRDAAALLESDAFLDHVSDGVGESVP